MKLILLNTSILTGYGTYTYKPLSLAEARMLVREFQQESKTIQSSIGHRSTAELLSSLLEFPVAVNRMDFKQMVNDAALVFKLRGRVPGGKDLSGEDIEALGYEFGLLVRIA